MYVVYGCEHLRDGIAEFAEICPTKEAALAVINRDRFAKDNYTFRLFELGKEIPLKRKVVPEAEKVVVKEHKVYEA